MQTSNEQAQNFYKQFGFSVEREIKDYYRDIEPVRLVAQVFRAYLRLGACCSLTRVVPSVLQPDCYILAKDLTQKRETEGATEAAAESKKEEVPALPAAE